MIPHALYWRRLLVTLAIVTLLFAVGWSRLDIEADVVGFLPQGDPVVADALYIFRNHPIQDQLIIDIGLTEDNPELLVECGRRVERHLRRSALFKTVGLQNFQSLIPALAMHILHYLPQLFSTEELRHQVEPLLEPQSVIDKMSTVQQSLLNLEGIGQSEFIARDPLGLKDIVMARLAHLAPSQSAMIYKGQIVSEDGRHLMVIADSAVSSTDTAFARQVADLMDTIAADVEETYGGLGHTITVTPMGAYRVALDNELIARKDVRNAILLATLGIVLLLMVTFPRPYLGVLSLLPAVAGTVAAFFVYSLLYETISLMVLGFGGAIISISVDHGIAYLLFLDRPYRTFGKDASREVRAVGLVAALTTIGAFSSLIFSGFPILEQLGRFTALGIAFSFVFVHSIFPRIFPEMVSLGTMNTVSTKTKAAEEMIARVWGRVFNKIYVMTEGETLSDLQAKGDRLVEMMIREQYSGRLSSGFAASMVFPGEQRQQNNFSAWKVFWNTQRVTALHEALGSASADLGFAPDAFKSFFDLLTVESYAPAPMVIPEKYFGLLGIRVDAENRNWLQVSSLTTGKAYQAETFLDKYSGLGKFFDPDYFSRKLGHLLFSTFMKMLVIIGLSVTILLFFYFVDISLTLIALLPVVFALICTLGTLNLMGRTLDIPALMLSMIVIGMGIDYSLFFVRSYQRYEDVAHPYFGLIRMTVFLAGTSTIIGFGVLSTAQHSLLKSAGTTLLLGIGYALVGAFVILPPLLKYRMRAGREDTRKNGSIQARVLQRYRMLEAYPRLFARFKMRFDPMFTELPRLLNPSEGAQTIMDIGCGYGVQTAWLLERFSGAEVVAIDPAADRVRVAARVAGKRASINVGGAPDIPALSTPADLVIMLDIVHYLDDAKLRLTLSNLHARLKQGGRLIMRGTVLPERRFPLLFWLEEFKLRLNRLPSYYRSVKSLQTMLDETGFRVDETGSSGENSELRWLIATKRAS
ncbi:MAG: MMPL family transporter [Deltaproteobacteria bacterium]|nr:MMPL family transporter [Deltaproteobacteria bacterium]